MIKSSYCIEDVAIEKSDIVLNKDRKSNGSGKHKNKPWNKNKYVINNGVVDTPNTKESNFNISNVIYATKQQETSNCQSFNKTNKSSKPKHVYTPIVESYEVVLKTFLANKRITLPNNY